MGEYSFYKALQSFTSLDASTLNIQKDDVLKIPIESPFSKTNIHWKGWLYACNQRTREEGYIPVEYVELLGSQVNNTYHHPSALGVEASITLYNIEPEKLKSTHNLVDVYFLTPVLCPHCNDYIWGQGRIGSQCLGE